MAPPPPSQPQTPRSSLLKYIIISLLSLIVITGLIIFIIWLAVRPRHFKYSIERGSITNYNLTNDHLTSNFYFLLRAENPNRHMSMYYDRIDVTVLYEDQKLSINNVHPFYQPKRNVTLLDMHLVAKNAAVYGSVGRDLKMERASGDLGLDVKIRAHVRLKVGVFKVRRTLKVFCPQVNVPFNASKEFESVSCDTDLD